MGTRRMTRLKLWIYNVILWPLHHLSYTQRQRARALPGVLALQYRVLKHLRSQLVLPASLLCLEGFPRSGNSFCGEILYNGVRSAREGMAGHTHAITNVWRAVKFDVPAFVVVRDPLDCCLSLLLMEGCSTLEDALGAYYDFHAKLLRLRDRVTVIPFEQLTRNPYGVVRRVAQQVGCELLAPEEVVVRAAKLAVETWNREVNQGNPLIDGLPNDQKETHKIEVLERSMNSKADLMLARCQALRSQILAAGCAEERAS